MLNWFKNLIAKMTKPKVCFKTKRGEILQSMHGDKAALKKQVLEYCRAKRLESKRK